MPITISVTLAGLSITEVYESDEGLTHLLRRANITSNERVRINTEGFNNLKSLIDTFATAKAFEDTIKDLKTRHLELYLLIISIAYTLIYEL